MLDLLGNTLANLVISLLPRNKFTKDYNENTEVKYPRVEIRQFLNAYEELYFFEKDKNLAPRLSRATQRLSDYLLQLELDMIRTRLADPSPLDAKLRSELSQSILPL